MDSSYEKRYVHYRGRLPFWPGIMTTSGPILCLSLARNYGPAGPLR